MILEIGGLALLLTTAALLIAPMLRTGRRQAGQARWPRVRGEVTAHQVRTSGDTGYPEYRVRYRFEGRDFDRFVGSADGLGHTAHRLDSRVRKAVEQRMNRRPVGSTTEIMVNPADHDEAYVVERELPARAIAFAAGTIFLLFALVFVFIAFD